MLSASAVALENYLMWRDVRFKFEPGVTVVGGGNRVGKTLLFKGLSQALWGNEFGQRGTESAKMPKGAKSRVELRVDGKPWEIQATQSAVELTRNGKSLKMGGKMAALNHLREMVPISKSLYDTTVHISGTTAHPLTHATPVKRLEWFSNILGADVMFDRLEKLAHERWSRANQAAAKVQALRDELAKLQQIGESDLRRMRKDLRLRNKGLNAARERLAQYSQAIEVKEILASLPETPKQVDLPRLEKRIARLEKELAAAEKHQAEHAAAAEERRRYRLAKRAVYILSRRLRKMPTTLERLDAAVAALKRLDEDAQQRARQWRESREARKEFAKLTPPKMTPRRAVALEDLSRKSLTDLTERIDRLMRQTAHRCDTCSQPISESIKEQLLSELCKQSDGARQSIVAAKEAQHYYKLKAELPREAKAHLQIAQWLPDFISGLEKKLTFYRKSAELLRRAEHEVRHKPRSLDAHEHRSTEVIRKELQAARANETRARAAERAREARENAQRRLEQLKVTADLPELIKARNKFTANVEKWTSTISDLTSKLAAAERDFEHRSQLLNTLSGERKRAKRVKALAELKEAFGKRGLRLFVLERMTSAFQDHLNLLAPLLWEDEVMFEIQVSEKGVDIQMTRRGATSDLTTLSGSEERAWKLLCALALIRILPPRLRADFIVLDELESHMEQRSRYMLANNYLPELLQSVPTVIFVSPLSIEELPIKADRRYRVEHKNGVSKLVVQ